MGDCLAFRHKDHLFFSYCLFLQQIEAVTGAIDTEMYRLLAYPNSGYAVIIRTSFLTRK